MRSSTWRASGSARPACCGPRRTASARRTRWACSRCGATGWPRSMTPAGSSSSRTRRRPPASAVTIALEGTRPLAVEIQALVAPAGYGSPRRATTGIDANRVLMLIAVLARHAGLNLSGHDVYVNVAGGLRIDEPAADLAVATALASSLRERPVRRAPCLPGRWRCPGDCAPPSAPIGGCWRRPAWDSTASSPASRAASGRRRGSRARRRVRHPRGVARPPSRTDAAEGVRGRTAGPRAARPPRAPRDVVVLHPSSRSSDDAPPVSSRTDQLMTRIIHFTGALLGTLIGFALGLALLERAA